MINLVIKDILIQKRSLIFLIIYFPMLFLITDLSYYSVCFLFVTTSIFSGLITPFAYDDRYKSSCMINSMPVTRKDVVLSKYIFVFVNLIFSVILILLLNWIMIYFTHSNMGENIYIKIIENDAVICIIFSSIVLPLLLNFGYMKTRYLYNIFLGLIIGTGSYFVESGMAKDLSANYIPGLVNLSSIVKNVICISIYFISMFISLKTYNKRDLC